METSPPASPRPPRKGPIRLALVVAFGLAVFALWSARAWIGWQLASATAAPLAVGPARVALPGSLPARMHFGADGDVTLIAGDIGYDAMALTLSLTPLEAELAGEEAAKAQKDLELALLADDPSAKLVERRFGPHLGFVADSRADGARSRFAVVVAGGALVRLEVLVHERAPGKWQQAADGVVDSLALDDVIATDGLWSTFSSRAWDACGSGDVDACLWTARSSWQRGKLDGAKAALERGLERTGPIEVLWNEAKAALPASAIAAGTLAPAAASPAGKRLTQAVELHLLLGELALAQGRPADAVEVWRRSWRFDADGRTAARMLTEAARLGDDADTEALVQLARDADERFGADPKVALGAARLASAGAAYDVAKAILQRLYDGHEDLALRREIVRVPLSPPPKLAALSCPKGAKAKRETTSMGTVVEACRDRAGKRQGPSRTWFVTTGYLLEEVTFTNDEPGAPDQRYWENGQLQRRSLVDATGAVTVERFDPFGREVAEDDGPPATDAALDVEGR